MEHTRRAQQMERMEEMGEKQGLAAQLAESQGQAETISAEEVMELLQQGVKPEDLIAKGVPIEVIREAIQMLMQREQQAQGIQPDSRQQMQPPGSGLASIMAARQQG